MQKYLLLLLLLIGILSCKKSTGPVKQEPDPPSPVLTLEKTYEPGVTEAWFRLTTENITFNDTVAITCNDSVVLKLTPVRNDTLFYCENLSPNTNYKCQAFYLKNKMLKDSSNAVYVTTLDTTTHDYTWQIFEFGGIPHGHSTFRDIAIIDENNIWAVGEIHTDSTDCWNEDSTEWLTPFNAANWDGQEWDLLRIPFNEMCGGVLYPGIFSLFSFDMNDIWFTSGGSMVHYNGSNYENDCSMNSLLDGGIRNIWGFSSSHLYTVGGVGTILHYNGQQWTKLTSGTDLPIQDIWGATDPLTGEEVILCVASELDLNSGEELLKISGNEVEKLSLAGTSGSFSSLWFMPGRKYYISGNYLFQCNVLGEIWKRKPLYDSHFKYAIRGTDLNNIFITTSNGEIWHFNGISNKNYEGFEDDIRLKSVDMHEDIIITCGYNYYEMRATIIMGTKN